MAYSIVNVDKLVEISSSPITSLHIGTLYGGLKNSLGQVTGNLKYANLDGTMVNPEGWCTIKLDPVGDETAVKILATCSENSSESADRSCTLKLQYGSKQTDVQITIRQKKKIVSVPEPTFTFETQILLDVLILQDHPNVRFSVVYVRADYESDNGKTYTKKEIISTEYFNNHPGTNIWFGTYLTASGIEYSGGYTGCPEDVTIKGSVIGTNSVKITALYIDGLRVHLHENDSGSQDYSYWLQRVSNISWSTAPDPQKNINLLKGPAGITLEKGNKLGDIAICEV